MMSEKRRATDEDLKAIGQLIADYCNEHNIILATVNETAISLAFRQASIDDPRNAEIEGKRAIVDAKQLAEGYVSIEEAAKRLDIQRELLSTLMTANKLNSISVDIDGNKLPSTYGVSYKTTLAGTYIKKDDIADKQALLDAYNQIKTVSTAQAAEIMGVTAGTFSKWAERATVKPTDEKWTNSGYKVSLWTLEQVQQVIEFRENTK